MNFDDNYLELLNPWKAKINENHYAFTEELFYLHRFFSDIHLTLHIYKLFGEFIASSPYINIYMNCGLIYKYVELMKI